MLRKIASFLLAVLICIGVGFGGMYAHPYQLWCIINPNNDDDDSDDDGDGGGGDDGDDPPPSGPSGMTMDESCRSNAPIYLLFFK